MNKTRRKNMRWIFQWIALCIVFAITLPNFLYASQIERYPRSDEQRLMEYLFENYNNDVRPVLNASQAVQIELQLQIMRLVELNTKEQFLTVFGWILVQWTDERLTWNTSDFGGLDTLVVKPHHLWLPSFSLENAADGSIYNEDWYNLFRPSIYNDGTIVWEPGGAFTSGCAVNVQYFPFDQQICKITFANWVFTGSQVNLSYSETAEKELLEIYIENGVWDILDVSVTREEFYYACCPEPYPEVNIYILLKRKSLFYITNIIILCLLLAVLVIMTTKVPPQTGERISMGVTLLLAFTIFILMISETIPDYTSKSVPLIIVYVISFMGITTLAICESVLSAYCFYHTDQQRPNVVLRCIVFGFMAYMVRSKHRRSCCRNNEANPETPPDDKQRHNNSLDFHHVDSHSSLSNSKINHSSQNGQGQSSKEFNLHSKRFSHQNGLQAQNMSSPGNANFAQPDLNCNTASRKSSMTSSTLYSKSISQPGDFVKLVKEVQRLNNRYDYEEQQQQAKKEWIEIAEILDDFSFWFFLILYGIVSIILMLILPHLTDAHEKLG